MPVMLNLLKYAVIAALLQSSLAAAQSQLPAPRSGYPDRPIRMLVGVPPGGSTDIVARIVMGKLGDGLGQQVIIDNRGGGGGIIAADIVAHAAPDGYTLLFAHASFTTLPFLHTSIPYDPIKSFTPITQVSTQPLVVTVHPSLPINSIKELIAYAKAHPGKLNIGIAGAGGAGHIASEYFKQLTGTDIVTVIYKGGGPAQVAQLGGEVQLMFASTATAIAFINQGKVRPLATSGKQRLPYLPDVPTLEEGGVQGLRISPWQGLIGPAGLPRTMVNRLHTEMASLLRLPDMRERLAKAGTDPVGSTPEEFAAEIRRELKEFGRVIKAAGIKGG